MVHLGEIFPKTLWWRGAHCSPGSQTGRTPSHTRLQQAPILTVSTRPAPYQMEGLKIESNTPQPGTVHQPGRLF
jgi:hypothetical protein